MNQLMTPMSETRYSCNAVWI